MSNKIRCPECGGSVLKVFRNASESNSTDLDVMDQIDRLQTTKLAIAAGHLLRPLSPELSKVVILSTDEIINNILERPNKPYKCSKCGYEF